MSIERVFHGMSSKKKGRQEDVDTNWMIFEKDGSVRYARHGELPANIFDNSDIDSEDGDLEVLEDPLRDLNNPWRKRKTRKEGSK
jgi:hypothetical protein